jgi:S1-C subfamily serine protease
METRPRAEGFDAGSGDPSGGSVGPGGPPAWSEGPTLPPPPGGRDRAPARSVDGEPKPRGRILRTWAVTATALLLFAGGYGVRTATTPTATNATPTTAATVVSAQSQDLSALVTSVEPSIVKVTSQVQQQNPFFGPSTGEAVGTGFIVSADGLIVTNYHVIEGASSIAVTLADGRQFQAQVANAADSSDLAVLKIDATGLTALELGNSSDVQAGQPVIAIGFALNLQGSPTVTSGIVSSTARTIQVPDENGPSGPVVRTYRDVIQISAAINSGNSGGPLLDDSGRVIGISSAGVQGANNIGFAIPIDQVKSLVAAA